MDASHTPPPPALAEAPAVFDLRPAAAGAAVHEGLLVTDAAVK